MRKIKINGFEIETEECKGAMKILGLMFKTRKRAGALIFEFPEKTRIAIHSFFVFFPFLAVWLDDKNWVIEKRIVKPFNPYVAPKRNYSKLVEIPLTEKYRKAIETLVAKN